MKLQASRGEATRWSVGDRCFMQCPGPERHWLGTVTGVRQDKIRVRFGREDVRVLEPAQLRRAT